MSLAERTRRIAPSGTMRVLLEVERLRATGVDLVDLGAGEPDFPSPAHVKAAGHAAIDADFTKYTANGGIQELRRAICGRCHEDYGLEVTEAETIVTAGGKHALFNAVQALFGPGDEVITHAPGWPTLAEQIRLADATPVVVRTQPEDGFAFRAGAFIEAMGPRTRGVVINTPCNPTGAVFSDDEMSALAEAAARRGLWVVLDLCYERLVFDGVSHSLPRVLHDRMRDRTVLACSASKAYAMTGWRCGWVIAPREVIAACNTIQGHSTSNICSITQRAAVAALTGPQDCVDVMRAEYRKRRDIAWALATADPRIRCTKPAGAFYLWLDVGDLLSPTGFRTSAELAHALLEEQHVAVTPGEAFDSPGYLRVSIATSVDRLETGIARIHAFVARQEREGRIPEARA